jgi:hypothetical protein
MASRSGCLGRVTPSPKKREPGVLRSYFGRSVPSCARGAACPSVAARADPRRVHASLNLRWWRRCGGSSDLQITVDRGAC